MFLQKFKKESKQFGAQRRASEAAAVADCIYSNMAINAGYQDVTRLTLRYGEPGGSGHGGLFSSRMRSEK